MTKTKKAKIVNSWAQVGGGVRYEVSVGQFTATIDATKSGKLTGFVRGYCPDEAAVLKAAFDAVR